MIQIRQAVHMFRFMKIGPITCTLHAGLGGEEGYAATGGGGGGFGREGRIFPGKISPFRKVAKFPHGEIFAVCDQ